MGVGFDRLSDQAYAHLRHAIIEGQIAAGTRLTELGLCKTLKMGRSPVREALLRLAGEGLVEAVPNAGFFVRCITLEDIEESYQIRTVLECLAVRMACQRGFSEIKLAQMEQLCHRMREASRRGDCAAADLTDLEFHQILISLANSRRIETAIHSSHLQIFSWTRKQNGIAHRQDDIRVLNEHQQMVNALRDRNAAEAERLLNLHILGTLQRRMQMAMTSGESATLARKAALVGDLAGQAG